MGGGDNLQILKIIISGMVDGLTGFLPVSSSGHLMALNNVLGFGVGNSVLFDMMLKIASIAVIAFAFRRDMVRLLKPDSGAYRKLALMILTATIATGITGVACRSFAIYAANTVFFPGVFLIITGVMLFLTKGIKAGGLKISDVGFFEAFVTGAVQGLSVLPGLSRCGMVMTVCMLFGFEKKLTWRFTFLSAVPSLIGAVLLDIFDLVSFGVSDAGNTGWYILAAVFAMITGYLGLVIVNRILRRGRFMIPAVYCLVLGGCVMASMVVL